MPEDFRDAQSMAHVYALLGRLWLLELDAPLLDALASSEAVRRAFLAAGGVLPVEAELDALATEYCRLFVGPRDHLPPLQSVWERGELQSEISTSTRQFAELVHFAAEPGTLWDHLGVQLQVMAAALGGLAAEAPSRQAEAQELVMHYFARHLAWPKPFLSQVTQRAEHPFYGALAALTDELLTSEGTYWQLP